MTVCGWPLQAEATGPLAGGPELAQPDTCRQDPMGRVWSADTRPEGLGKFYANLYFRINKAKIPNFLGLLCFSQVT